MIGFIGDLHGDFEVIDRLIRRNPDVTFWFQVGDLGDEDLPYPVLPSRFFFIQGNHENWQMLEGLKGSAQFLMNGFVYSFYDLGSQTRFTVAALGGNYSPRYYPFQHNDLPLSRKRHFVSEQVQNLLKNENKADILLTHEAPSPFIKNSSDIGQPIILDLVKRLCPRLHVFGHHHIQRTAHIGGTLSVGLGYGAVSVMLYDLKQGDIA